MLRCSGPPDGARSTQRGGGVRNGARAPLGGRQSQAKRGPSVRPSKKCQIRARDALALRRTKFMEFLDREVARTFESFSLDGLRGR